MTSGLRHRASGLGLAIATLVAMTGSVLAQPAADDSVPEPAPDAPKVTAVPSTREVMIGEQFYLFISVTHPPTMQVTLPASLPLGPGFEEVNRTDHSIRNADGTYTREFELALMAFDIGDVRIPSLAVTYAAAGQVLEVMTKPVPLRVISFIGDGEEKLRDIAPPIAVDRPDYTLVYVAGGVLLAVVVVVLALLVARMLSAPRAVRRRVPAAMNIRLPAHEEALARLDRLEGSGALDAADLKPGYHELSEIMRDYMGRVFGFPALDLTTLEIRNELLARVGGPPAEEMVREWFERCDLVKFAGAPTTPDEARHTLYDARQYIERIRALSLATEAAAARAAAEQQRAR